MKKLFMLFTLVAFVLHTNVNLQAQEHPSLFFKATEIPEIKKKIERSEWMSKAYDVLIIQADEMMKFGPEPQAYFATMDPAYAFNKNDKHWKKHGILGRIIEKRVGTLAMAGHLSGNQKYIEQAKAILLAAIRAIEPEEFLEHLQQSDAARGYAIGYDLLYPYLSKEEREVVQKGIEKIGAVLYNFKGVWSQDNLVINSQNHVSVHYGALGLCALVLGNKADWQQKATNRISDYVANFIDDTGYGTEGVDYTNYGLLGVVPYTVALERITGVDLLNTQPSISLVPDQMIWKMFPWGKETIAMNDAPTSLGSSAGLMYLISRYQLKEALWSWLKIEGEEGVKAYGGGTKGRRGDSRPSIGDGLSLPFVLLWGDPDLRPQAPSALSRFFSSGRVFMRDNWQDSLSSHVSFTSGIDYHQAHNHSDENSFTFNALGEEFAIDPGRFPWNTRSHNAILVNGIGQIKGYGKGRILDYKEMDRAVYVKGDAREAYVMAPHFEVMKRKVAPSEIQPSLAQRQLLYVRGKQPYLVIVDDYETENEAADTYTWLLHTDQKNSFSVFPKENKATIIGSKNGGLCDITFLWPQKGLLVEESDLTNVLLPDHNNMGDHDKPLANHFKELAAITKAKNPHFVSLLLARRANEAAPIITTSGDASLMEIKVKFENGDEDVILVSPENLSFKN